jgi:N-acetylglutamate synthase-like GNAT family acetyltransferase
MEIRVVKREEINDIRNIDRSEVINQFYYYKKGELVLKNQYYNITGWHPNNIERNITNLYELYDRDGSFFGLFQEERIVGVVALECKFIGSNNDQLQVVFLHIGKNYRKKGYGEVLMNKAKERAKELGAKKLYISATPSKNTVDFYIHLGCKLTSELNPELYKLEPDDIHLEMIL